MSELADTMRAETVRAEAIEECARHLERHAHFFETDPLITAIEGRLKTESLAIARLVRAEAASLRTLSPSSASPPPESPGDALAHAVRAVLDARSRDGQFYVGMLREALTDYERRRREQ